MGTGGRVIKSVQRVRREQLSAIKNGIDA